MRTMNLVFMTLSLCFVSSVAFAAPPPVLKKGPAPTAQASTPTPPPPTPQATEASKKTKVSGGNTGSVRPPKPPPDSVASSDAMAALEARITDRQQTGQKIFQLQQRMMGMRHPDHFKLFSDDQKTALDEISAGINKANGEFLTSTGSVPETVKTTIADLDNKVSAAEKVLAELSKAGTLPITHNEFSPGLYKGLLWFALVLLAFLTRGHFVNRRKLQSLLLTLETNGIRPKLPSAPQSTP